ncbi:E3 ubiquitin-protein ligase SH3RF2 isoform X2 [Hyperolius riggenbachi]|uniref:E3 ubiquitin-protein ligase SH3RF2 isoform X2 n=1 Tax=Hyperolius riggenbachi TaxID=752182 RepID=UPI0035A3AF68
MGDLVILDLLDCSVCLGKLDATAKVLPCQHTFCQPCLQRILKARKELKCPECRTPVHCSIEELPANLLLVRLLEGIKSGQGLVRKNSFQRMGGLFTNDSFKKSPEQKSYHAFNYRLFPKTRMPLEGVPYAKGLLNYKGQSPSDLSFSKGDIIILHRQLDENWYHGEVNGGSGVFPSSSVKIVKKIDQPPALCRALYNFELKDKDKGKNKDCLKFAKGDIISVIRRVDDNWAEGKLGEQVGIFPLLFVELNSTAKQLLESNNSKRKDANNMFMTPSPLKKSPLSITSPESATMRRVPEGRRKSNKQFLLTNALNTLNKMVHSPSGRQTPEISTPILISSSNTAVIERARSLASSANQANGSLYYATLGTQGTAPLLADVPNGPNNILANMCIALHPYTAHGPDQIDLQRGEGIRILGKFQEGWLRGISLVTGKVGIFPSHCVHSVSRQQHSELDHLNSGEVPSMEMVPSLPIAVNSRKSSNYPPDAKTSPHQTKWISSNASVSSQSSMSETGITRPIRTFYVPPSGVEAMKKATASSSALLPVTLRRRNSDLKKSGPFQKNMQNSPALQSMSTMSRPASTVPQQIIINADRYNVGASAETWTRPSSQYDFLPFTSRPVDYRRYSAASSFAFEPREPLSRNNSIRRPLTYAPPSILVKPDTPKTPSNEKVKTVRFMNFSPPAVKRHSGQFDVKDEEAAGHNVVSESSPTAEAVLTVLPLRPNPSLVQRTEGRKIQKLKSTLNDITPLPSHATLSFPKKRTLSDNSNRGSAIYQAQEIPSS